MVEIDIVADILEAKLKVEAAAGEPPKFLYLKENGYENLRNYFMQITNLQRHEIERFEEMERVLTIIFVAIGVLALYASLGLLLAFPIKWCWNYTMPIIFGFSTINWGQAWCLNFLAGCLIKTTQTNIK